MSSLQQEPKTQHNIFNKLIEIGLALSSEHNHNRLMERILTDAQGICNADGGTLYLHTGDHKLKFEIMCTVSKSFAMGGVSGQAIPFSPLDMFDQATGSPNYRNIATFTAHNKRIVNIPDAYETAEFDFSGTKEFDKRNNYRTKSILTVPLINHETDVIAVLQLINATDPETNEIIPFGNDIQLFINSLSSILTIVLENNILINAQKALLDSMIKLIAGAIDAKSRYTGNHCQRVPVLAKMLAEAACASNDPAFKDFSLTEEEKHELHIGAWLHDCGKLTTPVNVVDKATKLETIYDRIHEVRMRFEVLKRDAVIDYMKAHINSEGDPTALSLKLKERLDQLDADYAFIAATNIGGEFMTADKMERVKKIAGMEWTRTLDDCIGVSNDELARKALHPKQPLPVKEKLLSDKDEHLFSRDDTEIYVENNPHGFKIAPPKYKYNKGEIYNLCISKGTLTPEDFFIVKEHVMQSIMMLQKLPFPKFLKRVPEYAGGHHETMIGTGYPRKLTKNDMSIPSRIMAIADIFEALTAADRPYKKPLKLSESIKILFNMKKDQGIDPDLFNLFLKSGIYKKFADHYLSPAQIDEVNISQYLDSGNAGNKKN